MVRLPKADTTTASSSSEFPPRPALAVVRPRPVRWTRITTDQVAWIWLHLKQDYAGKHVTIQDMFFTQTTNDDGTLRFRSRKITAQRHEETGVTELWTQPWVVQHQFEGELTDNTAGDSKVIATEYGK